MCEYGAGQVLEVDNGVPPMFLDIIVASVLSVSSVRIVGMTMLKKVGCKWSRSNGSCNNENAAVIVYLYGENTNFIIVDGRERCGWKVRKIE
jgi:hypothetical protein